MALPAVDLEVFEPLVFFVAPSSIVRVSARQASVHIQPAFSVSTPVFVAVKGVDIFRHSIFYLSPNIVCHSRLSNFSGDVHKESFGSSMGSHANDDLCRIFSNQNLYRNKNVGCTDNKPNPGHNDVSGTSALPRGATTSHPRKRGHRQCQGQRKRTYQG